MAVPLAQVPWLAAHADRFFAVLATLSLLAALALVVWERTGQELPAVLGPGSPLAATLVTLTLWGVYLMWKVPQWQAAARASNGALDERDLFEIENAARGTLGQILSGVAVVTGLLFAWQQLGNTSENLRVSQEGQITDRFSRAVEQLGSDDPTVRIGAIYALERIGRDSERDHRPAMEVLTSFLRERYPRRAIGEGTPDTIPDQGRTERQAVLGIIGRRDPARDGAGGCLSLSGTDLVGAELAGAALDGLCLAGVDLSGADLAGASLTGSVLARADLGDADLRGAKLNGADLTQANASSAVLEGSDLSGVSLLGADLSGSLLNRETNLAGADLNGANLSLAFLFGVDLSTSRGLTTEQVATALTDGQTTLPPGMAATPDV